MIEKIKATKVTKVYRIYVKYRTKKSESQKNFLVQALSSIDAIGKVAAQLPSMETIKEYDGSQEPVEINSISITQESDVFVQ